MRCPVLTTEKRYRTAKDGTRFPSCGLVPYRRESLCHFRAAALFRSSSVEASLRCPSVLRVVPNQFAATASMDKTELRLDPLTGDWAIFNKRVYGQSWIPLDVECRTSSVGCSFPRSAAKEGEHPTSDTQYPTSNGTPFSTSDTRSKNRALPPACSIADEV